MDYNKNQNSVFINLYNDAYPSEWNLSKIGEIVKFKLGKTPKRKVQKYWENGKYPWVSIADMNKFENIYTTKEKISEIAFQEVFHGKLVPKNTLLMSFKLTIGRTSIIKIDAQHNEAIISIFPKEKVIKEFLLYYLPIVNYSNYYDTVVKGKTLNKSKINNIKIPLPPFPEQKKIAGVLSAVQEAKEKTEEVIKAAKELKKSWMKHIFTYGQVSIEEAENVKLKETEIGMMPEDWNESIINKVIEKTNQKNPKKDPFRRFKYVDVSSIDRESLKITEYKNYIGKYAPSRARKNIEKDDVIFATVRPTLKRISIIDEDFSGEICSTAFCVLRVKKDTIDSRYLFYYVQRDIFVKRIGKIQRGASYPAVTDSDIKNQKIFLPQSNVQKKIANILSTIDYKIQAEQNKKKALEELFKSLLNNLITGKIRVNHLDLEI